MNGKLSDLADESQVAEKLRSAGFSPVNAFEKARRFAELSARLSAETNDDRAVAAAWFVPGRIEVFGKHTDYAGGRSVVAAAERGFCGVAVARDDAQVQVIDVPGGVEVAFPCSADLVPTMGCWSNYPMTVVRRLAANFPTLRRGATIALASDLPPAAGMSSSSALMVTTFLLLGELNAITQDPAFRTDIRAIEDLAGFLGTVENGQTFKHLAGDQGVGTFGGSEDHTAMLCAQAGKWVQYSYCPVRHERTIEVPRDYQFVIGVSGIVAEKTGAARECYNRASRRAAAVTQIWHEATGCADPHLAAIVRTSPEAFVRLRKALDVRNHQDFARQELIDRLEQFLTESEAIIPAIPDVVKHESLARVGELAHRSQREGAEKLANQIPETIFLAESARRVGAVAASAQGAGFGGSVWALVAEGEIEPFIKRWSAAYHAVFPTAAARAAFFATRPGPAATSLLSSTLWPWK